MRLFFVGLVEDDGAPCNSEMGLLGELECGNVVTKEQGNAFDAVHEGVD